MMPTCSNEQNETGNCDYLKCPEYNHPEIFLNFKAECKSRGSFIQIKVGQVERSKRIRPLSKEANL